MFCWLKSNRRLIAELEAERKKNEELKALNADLKDYNEFVKLLTPLIPQITEVKLPGPVVIGIAAALIPLAFIFGKSKR